MSNHGCIDTMVVDYSVKGVTSVQASQKPLLMFSYIGYFSCIHFFRGNCAHSSNRLRDEGECIYFEAPFWVILQHLNKSGYTFS